MKSTIDMTSGQPLRLMMRFAVPILLSSVLQQLYTLADSMIVGRFLGMNAFAAVSAAGFIAWLPQNMMLGLTHGFGVVLSHLFGAGDPKGFNGPLHFCRFCIFCLFIARQFRAWVRP